jgi:hypothetical protein
VVVFKQGEDAVWNGESPFVFGMLMFWVEWSVEEKSEWKTQDKETWLIWMCHSLHWFANLVLLEFHSLLCAFCVLSALKEASHKKNQFKK